MGFTLWGGSTPPTVTKTNIMTQNFEIGMSVKYRNGSTSIYQGTIVKIMPNRLVVIGDEAGMKIWNSGVACGDCISPSQVIL